MKIKKNFIGLIIGLIFSITCYANSKPKYIALTFDDGPSNIYTEQVLKILAENHAKATFFVMGLSAKKNPEVLKKVYASGNDIGNHTYTHPNLSKLDEAEIINELTKNDAIIYKTINVHPVLFRPPFGMSSSLSNQVATKLGYKKVTWDYMVNDYDSKKTTSDIIASSVIKHASPGAIITMHDCCIDRSKTVAALPIIIDALQKNGYQLVTVSEILKVSPYRDNNQN